MPKMMFRMPQVPFKFYENGPQGKCIGFQGPSKGEILQALLSQFYFLVEFLVIKFPIKD